MTQFISSMASIKLVKSAVTTCDKYPVKMQDTCFYNPLVIYKILIHTATF